MSYLSYEEQIKRERDIRHIKEENVEQSAYEESFYEPEKEVQQVKDDWGMDTDYGDNQQNDYPNSGEHYSKPTSEFGIYIIFAILILGGMFLFKSCS